MINSLQQLKSAEKNLGILRDSRKKQKYMGCGLMLTVSNGSENHDSVDLSFGCSTDCDILMNAIIFAQEDVVMFWKDRVIEDLNDIREYLNGSTTGS